MGKSEMAPTRLLFAGASQDNNVYEIKKSFLNIR